MIEVDIDAARAAVAKLGVQLCIVFPAAMLALALILKKRLYSADAGLLQGGIVDWLGYAFIAVAFADLIVALLIKRKYITPENLARRLTPRPNSFAKQLAAAYVPVLALCAAPAVYGLIFYFVGGDQQTYVLISVFCPAAYLVTRPRLEEVEAIATELFRSETDSDLKL